MLLWTWQHKDFSIINPEQKVEPLKYSTYLNDKNILKAYQKLWDILETCQFHWYSATREEDRISVRPSQYRKDEFLWEVKIKKDNMFKVVCFLTWSRLIGRKIYIPQHIHDLWLRKAPDKYDELEKEFKSFWECKTEDQLWKLLLLDSNGLHDISSVLRPCTQVLLRHPVKEEWVTKNPIKLGNWWESQERSVSTPAPQVNCDFATKIPCHQCPWR